MIIPSNKKEKIMNAARQLFTKNFNSVSTDEIAKKASVRK